MLIHKNYHLANASVRANIDLCQFEDEIKRAAEMTFKSMLVSVVIYSTYFTLSVSSKEPSIQHGVLVNFGKNIARQTLSLNETAMRTYQSAKHPTSRQLFRCCD